VSKLKGSSLCGGLGNLDEMITGNPAHLPTCKEPDTQSEYLALFMQPEVSKIFIGVPAELFKNVNKVMEQEALYKEKSTLNNKLLHTRSEHICDCTDLLSSPPLHGIHSKLEDSRLGPDLHDDIEEPRPSDPQCAKSAV
jgi:hypothetical protein